MRIENTSFVLFSTIVSFPKTVAIGYKNYGYIVYYYPCFIGNKLIKNYLNWHSNAAKAGFISVRRPFVSKVVKYLPEQEIISLAEYVAKTTNKDSILLMKNEYTIKSALNFLESWIKVPDYPYRHEETNMVRTSIHTSYSTIWE
jgi:hypothetical protein